MGNRKNNCRSVVVIPARYASGRFPGKPLTPILGKPMIVRTWERCIGAFEAADVFVATDDERIAAVCDGAGINVVMTPATCLTGTDRVYHAAKNIDADIYINVQGDEPALDPGAILAVRTTAEDNPGAIVNAMCQITEEKDFRSPSFVKVVTRPDGRLLYMSRAAIPTTMSFGFAGAMKQVGIYAFDRGALESFANQECKTSLESLEDIEILRFVETGFDVHMVEVAPQVRSVDTADDVAIVEAALSCL